MVEATNADNTTERSQIEEVQSHQSNKMKNPRIRHILFQHIPDMQGGKTWC